MAKLARLGELLDSIESGKILVSDGLAFLDEIDKTPNPFGIAATTISFVLGGIGFAVYLSGGWWDAVLSGVLSLVVLGLMLQLGRLRGGASC